MICLFFGFCLGVSVDVNVSVFLVISVLLLFSSTFTSSFSCSICAFSCSSLFCFVFDLNLIGNFPLFLVLSVLFTGWFLFLWLELEVGLTFCWSIIQVYVLLYLSKVVSLLCLVLHYLLIMTRNSWFMFQCIEFFEFTLPQDLFR